MKTKNNIFKIAMTLIFASFLLVSACKKDQLTVNDQKVFLQENFKSNSSSPYNSGWQLTLQVNGVADILPGGDIVWRGTYKISGKQLTVKAENTTYNFEILSEQKIREKSSGTILITK